MKRLYTILLSVVFALPLFAEPVYPGRLEYTQPDGSVVGYYMHGDEHLMWITDDNGNCIAMGEDGYFHPAQMPSAEVKQAALEKGRRKNGTYLGELSGLKGTVNIPVLLVEFADISFSRSKADFERFFNGDGIGSKGSVKDYYATNSDGVVDFNFVIFGPITLDGKASQYENAQTALSLAFTKMTDDAEMRATFESYTYSKRLIMVHAGYSQTYGATTKAPYSNHMSSISVGWGYESFKYYACVSELRGTSGTGIARIGSTCHEIGHLCGLPDLYNAGSSSSVTTTGCSNYSLMHHGSHNTHDSEQGNGCCPPPLSILERIMCGWLTESSLEEISTSGAKQLYEVNQSSGPRALVIPTDTPGEIFICEYRSTDPSVDKWGTGLASGGMLVYHIDRSSRSIYLQGYGNIIPANVWGNDDLSGHYNANPDHPLWYLVPAASNYNYSLTASNSSHQKMIPFPGTKNVINYNPISWNDVETDVSLTGINFSNSRNYIAFNANCRNFPMINNPGHGVYSADSTFALRVNYGTSEEASSVAWYLDGESVAGSSVTLASGKHKISAVLTYSSGKVRRLNLEVRAD